MNRAALLAVLLGGCFDPTYNNPTCGPGGECPSGFTCEDTTCVRTSVGEIDAEILDAPIGPADAPDGRPIIDAPDAPMGCTSWSFAPANVPCMDPTGNLTIANAVSYNTDNGTFSDSTSVQSMFVTQDFGPAIRVWYVDNFTLFPGKRLKLEGSAALAIIVHGTAIIGGTIDAAAIYEVPGAGAPAVCTDENGGVASNISGGGGGGGGGYQSFGGRGGAGSSDGGGASGDTAGQLLTPLIGGCFGGVAAGNNGAGGGAVQISARDAITISGTIDVSGGGGRSGGSGGTLGGGGGGAGAGGGILLQAPMLNIGGAQLCADGGSGGEGGYAIIPPAPGTDGENGKCGGIAVGGSGSSPFGGNGGNGGYLAIPASNGSDYGTGFGGAAGGGGGGGGGGGVVLLRGTTSGTETIITPPALHGTP